MSRASYGRIQWASEDDHRHYLVTWGIGVGEGDDVRAPFGFASMGEIVDKLSDTCFHQQYSDAGDPDVVAVWRLTDYGPVPVTVTERLDRDDMVVTFTWREPRGVGIRAVKRTETAWYRYPGA